jgi:hypothetical protein
VGVAAAAAFGFTNLTASADPFASQHRHAASRRADGLPQAGPAAGFTATSPGVSFGAHTVCAYALNRGAGTANTKLGCKTLTRVDTNNPRGATAFGLGAGYKLTFAGWAFDSNLTPTM